MQTQKNVAILSKQALKHNVAQLRKMAPQSKILAMIKANAYGHGMLQISQTLLPLVDALAVATVEEACLLREVHPTYTNIVVMEGALYLDELIYAIDNQLTLVLHHEHELALFEQYLKSSKAALNLPLSVWVQVDTGMHRLGFLPSQIPDLLLRLKDLQEKNLIHLKGWLTHFSASDDLSDEANQFQLAQYHEHVAPLMGEKSMANSGAILQMPETHQDWIRPGLLLYGASPLDNKSAKSLGFKPVMTLTSPILATRKLSAGTRIGYNGIWTASRGSVIATVGIGYGDGYPRHVQENTPVWLNHQRFPIVGRVSMDMLMVDVTDYQGNDESLIGSRVELWGEHISVEEIAKQANTIPYELFCQLTPRIKFDWTI